MLKSMGVNKKNANTRQDNAFVILVHLSTLGHAKCDDFSELVLLTWTLTVISVRYNVCQSKCKILNLHRTLMILSEMGI